MILNQGVVQSSFLIDFALLGHLHHVELPLRKILKNERDRNLQTILLRRGQSRWFPVWYLALNLTQRDAPMTNERLKTQAVQLQWVQVAKKNVGRRGFSENTVA